MESEKWKLFRLVVPACLEVRKNAGTVRVLLVPNASSRLFSVILFDTSKIDLSPLDQMNGLFEIWVMFPPPRFVCFTVSRTVTMLLLPLPSPPPPPPPPLLLSTITPTTSKYNDNNNNNNNNSNRHLRTNPNKRQQTWRITRNTSTQYIHGGTKVQLI